MKAIVRERYGSVDALELREVAEPSVDAGEVLVKVRAAGVNMADVDYMRGSPPVARLGTGLRVPTNRGLGLDVAGVVEAVGANATRFKVGDEVYGDLTEFGYGAFAEYVAAPESAFAPKPAGLTFEQAAAVPQGAVLAMQGLRARKPVSAGDRVLVNGASGGVGPFAVQIAKARGAEVTAVCSTNKMEMVASIGADHVIDYGKDDFARRGQRYDRILDVAASRSVLQLVRVLRPGGVYVWEGGSMRRLLEVLTLGSLISLAGSRKVVLVMWKPFASEDMEAIGELLEAGSVVPVIDRSYTLAEVPDALRYVEEGRAQGKVIISV